MKFFGIILAALAVASAALTKDEVISAIWQVGRAEVEQANAAMATIFNHLSDSDGQTTWQDLINNFILFGNLGYTIGSALSPPYTDANSFNGVNAALSHVLDILKQTTDLAKAKGVAGASDLQKRYSDVAAQVKTLNGDFAGFVGQPDVMMINALSVDVLNRVLTFAKSAASLMNDSVVGLSKV